MALLRLERSAGKLACCVLRGLVLGNEGWLLDNLANQLEKGDGIGKDLSAALKWYSLLSEKGDERAKRKQLQLEEKLAMIEGVHPGV